MENWNHCKTDSPITDVKNSGAELPAAMNVAPATSSDKSNLY